MRRGMERMKEEKKRMLARRQERGDQDRTWLNWKGSMGIRSRVREACELAKVKLLVRMRRTENHRY